MHVQHCDEHVVPLPEGHRFPMGKYARLRHALVGRNVLAPVELHASQPVDVGALLTVHAPAYVSAMLDGSIDPRAMRRIGLPWSPELVARSRASVGGTLAAARVALDDGFAGNLAGGTHHAFADAGSGYCVWNDLAVTARVLLDERRIRRALVVDLDVHQGDGTAAIFAGDARVFTLSLHGAKNFPFTKQTSDLDVELPDGTDDLAYLMALARSLEDAFARAGDDVDLVLYQAGVDPLVGDRLGRLALTHDGLRARDEHVLLSCRRRGVPVVMTLGGGYADPIDRSIDAHVGSYEVARAVFG